MIQINSRGKSDDLPRSIELDECVPCLHGINITGYGMVPYWYSIQEENMMNYVPRSIELDECVPGLHRFGKRGGREDVETVLHHSLARLGLLA
jgi:hypothetical protein